MVNWGMARWIHLSSAWIPLPSGMGRNGRLLSISARLCEKRALSRGVTASVVPNAGDSEWHRPQGRSDSGCLWYVDGSDSPTLVVNRPPDANRVGMCGNLRSQAKTAPPEGDGVNLPSCKPLASAMGWLTSELTRMSTKLTGLCHTLNQSSI